MQNGSIHWASVDLVTSEHVNAILISCISNRRYLHINTGTHGMEDGSTVFWTSDKTMEWLKDRKNMKTWVEGANKFTNEDMQ